MNPAPSPLQALLAEEICGRRNPHGIDRMLHAVRTHLSMDVAFVSQFRSDDRVFSHVDSAGRSPIRPGDTLSLDQGYCQKVIDGRLPELIPDAGSFEATAVLPETHAIPIG